MKLRELVKVMVDTQPIKVLNANDLEEIIYDGIKAGCIGGFSDSEVKKISIVDNQMIVEAEYHFANVMNSSDDELLGLYFDDADLDMDIEDLEKKLVRLAGELDDIHFGF